MGTQNANQDNEFISDINVTPLVDVILVLLIIFMISAPLLMNDITLKLAKTKKVQSLSETANVVSISIDSFGVIYFDKVKVNIQILESHIRKEKINKDRTILIRADEKTDYMYVAKVLAILKSLNFQKISLVTEIEKK